MTADHISPAHLQSARDRFIDVVHETLAAGLYRIEADGGPTLEQIGEMIGRDAAAIAGLMVHPERWTLSDLSDLWPVVFGAEPNVRSAPAPELPVVPANDRR